MDQKQFNEEKKRLKETYKLYKAGLIKETEISPHIKTLLVKYYGVTLKYQNARKG